MKYLLFVSESNFEKPLYQGFISFEGELELVDIKYGSNTADEPTFVIRNEDAQFFDLESESNVIKLALKPSNIGWKGRTFLNVQVNAVVDSKVKATTEVLIDVLEAGEVFFDMIFIYNPFFHPF